jgi:nitroimidazol reductase NimA-like FMN-containing flavoprotein (pyridoxamine 5'-phosphate oxidase superfamily)
VIATLQPDASPNTVATWYLWENGRVLVNMDEGRKRLEYLRQDPRVSITVLGKNDWYHHVSLRGRIVSLEDDADNPTSTGSHATTPASRTPITIAAGSARGSRSSAGTGGP